MNILVISVHPDDETLGCGGTLLKHKASGDSLFWLIVTQTFEPQWSSEIIERKDVEIQRVAQAYEMQGCFKLGFPAVQLDTVPQVEVMERVRKVLTEVTPEVVYVVHSGDVHTDHQAVFCATMSVLKPFYMARYCAKRVLSYEALSSTEAAPPHLGGPFIPNVFNDITPFIDRKIEIMGLYGTEAQPYPLPRSGESIRALARYRGATVGMEYVEAFMLIREIW
jgi:LmbE family N-acetylglucosaminyl deacetylase